LSIFDLAVDFIGFGRPAAGRPNPMKSTAKSKMDKVEPYQSVASVKIRGELVSRCRVF